jgi:hypothetical protein
MIFSLIKVDEFPSGCCCFCFKVFNLVHGAKHAIGESLGHTSLPDTMGNIEDIVKNLPEDPEVDKEKLLETLGEQTSGWLGGLEATKQEVNSGTSSALIDKNKPLPNHQPQTR